MADKRISQLVERTTLANNDVLPIVASGASTTNKVTLQTIEDWMQGNLNFGVTSVAISVPTGLTVTGSPITSTGTFIIGFAAGYSIPTNTKQSEWDSAYNDKINSVAVTGTTTKTITLTQQDGGTLSAQWSDLQPVTSVFGRTGDVVAVEGDYSLDQLSGVGITSPSSGQVLKYDGTNWVNATEQYVGTVTSVGVSVPAAFSVTGSPITTSGTITISGAGTSAQYIDGTGSLQTFPNLIAQATNLVREVYNNSGATMTKGTVVYINGGHGNLPTIAKAKADADSTSAQTYGVVQANISDQSNGYIVVVGDLTNIDTQGYLEGTQLYLSGTTAGNYTSTKPYAPIHIVYVGIVTRSHPTQGIIAIKIQNGYEMDEIHDVDAQNPSNNDILQYKTATGLWTKTAGTTTNIAEGTNLYYTNERARQSISETITGIDYDNTTGVFSTTSGYGIPTTAKQTQWDAAYNDKINSASVSGTTTKTLTLTQQDGGTITTSWSDYDTAPVTSVFGRTGAIVATEGDYNLTQLGDVTITTPSNGQVLKYNGTTWVNDTGYVGTVTSVGLSVPTGLSVSGSPITTSGTLAISLASGYSIPTTASQTNWDAAYNDKINSAAVTGTTTKTLTLTQQDGGTITASWTDINTDAVTSVFGRTGAVVATEGDYTLTQLGDVTITTPTNGQFLKYDGTSWINAAAGTVTSVALATGTTGTDVGVTGSPITGAGTITLNIPVASATNTGKLSNTDWVEFNSKPYGSGNSNRIAYWNGVNSLAALDTATYPSLTELSYVKGVTSSIQTQLNNITGNYVTTNTNQDITARKTFRGDTGASLNFNNTANTFVGAISTYKDWFSGGTSTDLAIGAVANLYLFSNNGSNWAMKLDLNRDATFATKVKIDGGTTSQFLKANGDLDSTSYVPTSRTITINGNAQDLSANRSWSINYLQNLNNGLTSQLGDGTFVYSYALLTSTPGIFTTSDNSNAVFTFSRHPDNYYSQLGFNSSGAIFYRSFNNEAINTTKPWVQVWHSGSLTNLNQLTNGPGYITSYTETDTLQSVTNRGSSTSNSITCTGVLYMKDSGPSINENRINAGWNSTGDTIDLWINYEGYQNSNGYFRDFRVGDGKRGSSILFIDGSTRNAQFTNNVGIGQSLTLDAGALYVSNGSGTAYSTQLSTNYSYPLINSYLDSYAGSQYSGRLHFRTNSGGGGMVTQYTMTHEGLHYMYGRDESGARTSPYNTLTIETDNNSNPYNGFGGGILFRNRIYAGGPTPGGIRNGARIRTAIQNNSSVNYGTDLVFENTSTGDGALNEMLRLSFDGQSIFTGRVVTPELRLPDAGRIVVNNESDTWGARFRTTTSTANLGGQLKNIIYCGGGQTEGFAITGVGTGIASFEVANNGNTYVKGTLTAQGMITGNLTGNVTGEASSAATLVSRYRGSFTVGGNASTFYPVAFQIGSTATDAQGVSVLQIERGGYDDPGFTGIGFSTFHCRIRAKADGWGYGASYWRVEANAYTQPCLADVSQQNQTSQLIVWLRGATAYRWRDIEGGWSLNFSNPSGTSYSTFNGNAVYYATTTNSIGATFHYQPQWGQVYYGGTITAGGDVVAYSDARVKSNLRPIENVLERVCKSRGIMYDRTDVDSKDNIGFIAQELEETFPELVITEGDKKSVKYQNATAILFEAIKEQQKQIEELKKVVYAIAK